MNNTVQLLGRVGRDPDCRTFGDNKYLTRISLATNESYRDAKGTKRLHTEWHQLIGWGKTAEQMRDKLHVGQEVIIYGRLTHRRYQDGHGIPRMHSQVIVREFITL